jgi:site-specific recombinase XerD
VATAALGLACAGARGRWLAERPTWPGADGPALFLSAAAIGSPRDAIGDVLDRITAAAGLDDEITAHSLRHTFARSMLRQGVDMVTVAQLLGHALLETTRVLTRPDADDLTRAIETLPDDN